MGVGKEVGKWISGSIGSIFMFVAILLLMFTFVSVAAVDNIDNLQDSVKGTVDEFVEENKEEVAKLAFEFLDDTDMDMKVMLNKDNAILACENKEEMIQDRPDLAEYLTDEICDKVGDIRAEDFSEEIVEVLVTEFGDEIVDGVFEDITEDQVNMQNELDEKLNEFMPFVLVAIIVLFLIGAFFTLLGAEFNGKKFLYKLLLKIGICLLLGMIILLILFATVIPVATDTILSELTLDGDISGGVANMAPSFISKMALDWASLSIMPIIIGSAVVGVIMILLSILVYFTLVRKKK